MISIPDVLVLDFCEWLHSQLVDPQNDKISILDVLYESDNQFDPLKYYAERFLNVYSSNCNCKSIMQKFFFSKEYKELEENQCVHCKKKCEESLFRSSFRIPCNHLYYAYCNYLENRGFREIRMDYSPRELAWYFRFLINHQQSNLHNFPQMQLLIDTARIELADALNFLEWLKKLIPVSTNVSKIPETIFKKYVDRYVEEYQITDVSKKRLLKLFTNRRDIKFSKELAQSL